MDGLIVLLPKVHAVDREVLSLLLDPRFASPARRVLYGVRYWPRVKAAVLTTATQATGMPSTDFVARVIQAADAATRTARVDADLLLGITIAAIDLYDRVGQEAFVNMSAEPNLSSAAMLETPTMVLRRRARNHSEGVFSALPGVRRRWSVTREPNPDDTYVVGDGDPLAPCRGGNHEGCDVGIVAGADRVSPSEGPEPFPLIRRACQTRVFGRVSLLPATL
jgi:hypothetical protein